jgi:hypothetical protein
MWASEELCPATTGFCGRQEKDSAHVDTVRSKDSSKKPNESGLLLFDLIHGALFWRLIGAPAQEPRAVTKTSGSAKEMNKGTGRNGADPQKH